MNLSFQLGIQLPVLHDVCLAACLENAFFPEKAIENKCTNKYLTFSAEDCLLTSDFENRQESLLSNRRLGSAYLCSKRWFSIKLNLVTVLGNRDGSIVLDPKET